jgi:hypothetical protein
MENVTLVPQLHVTRPLPHTVLLQRKLLAWTCAYDTILQMDPTLYTPAPICACMCILAICICVHTHVHVHKLLTTHHHVPWSALRKEMIFLFFLN